MDENNLKEHIKNLGASLVGFADLRGIDENSRKNMDYGIAIGIKLKPDVIERISEGPTKDYYDEYKRVNKLLDGIVLSCVKYINSQGYNAIGQTTSYVTEDDNLATPLPHKTVATRAGLGWIGKNALLITTEYGSAIRISSILTDMMLETDTPINTSKCGKCTCCTAACPASAIKGKLWNINISREELIDPFKCRKKARELLKQNVGIESAICGKCINVCPFTKRYIKNSELVLK